MIRNREFRGGVSFGGLGLYISGGVIGGFVLIKRVLKRLLSLFMALLLFIMPVMIPRAEAIAAELIVTNYVFEIVGGILVASGLVVAGSDDVFQLGKAYNDWIDDTVSSVLDPVWAFARKAVDGSIDVAKTAFRVSADLWDSIFQFLTEKGFETGSVSVGDGTILDIPDKNSVNWVDLDLQSFTVLDESYTSYHFSYEVLPDAADSSKYTVWFTRTSINSKGVVTDVRRTNETSSDTGGGRPEYFSGKYYFRLGTYSGGSTVDLMSLFSSGGSNRVGYDQISKKYPHKIMTGDALSIPVSGDLAWPSEHSLVKAPDLPTVETDENGKETIYVPDLSLNPADHVADIPIDAAGNPVDVPYDVPVDVTTGAEVGNPDIPDTPTTPDIPILGDLFDFLKGILEAILNAIKSLIDGIVNGIKNAFGWLQGLIQRILDAILSIPDLILNGLKSLFIPKAGFLEASFEKMLEPLRNKLPITVYNDLFKQLANVGAKELQNVTVTLYGQKMTILDWKYYKANKETFDNVIRGFVFVLLLLYNINNVYKLASNKGLLDGDSRGGKKEGGGKP